MLIFSLSICYNSVMIKKENNLVNKCCSLYELELSEFCKKYELSESTMKDWRKNLPSYGKVMLEQLIENYHLKKKIEKKDKMILNLKSKINSQIS